MNKKIIAPSILSANFAKLGQEVNDVIASGAELIHFDVMDNHFVPNLTIGSLVCDSLKKEGIKTPIDVHLMCSPVDSLIKQFLDAGADYITFHPEASNDVSTSLDLIIKGGAKAGLVYNPDIPIDSLPTYIDRCDMVLLMTVFPGFGGQAFIPSVIPKIEQTRQLIDKTGKPIRLEVDGGINLKTIKSASDAGADTFVMGSAIFHAPDYKHVIHNAKTIISDS